MKGDSNPSPKLLMLMAYRLIISCSVELAAYEAQLATSEVLVEIHDGKVQIQEMRHECMLGVDGGAPIEGGLQSSSNTEVL